MVGGGPIGISADVRTAADDDDDACLATSELDGNANDAADADNDDGTEPIDGTSNSMAGRRVTTGGGSWLRGSSGRAAADAGATAVTADEAEDEDEDAVEEDAVEAGCEIECFRTGCKTVAGAACGGCNTDVARCCCWCCC